MQGVGLEPQSHACEAVRKIKPNCKSVTGFYVSRKGRKLIFESKLERDAYILLDFEPCVKDVIAQPLCWKFHRIGNYIPDCSIIMALGQTIAEIKHESELVEAWPKLSVKYFAANNYCLSNGLKFGFVTDAFVYHPRYRLGILKQIRFLGSAKDANDYVQNQLVNILQSEGPTTIKSLAEEIDAQLDYAQRIGEICKLLCRGSAQVVKTPTPHLPDCVISAPEYNTAEESCARVISFEQLLERIRTHPYRHLSRGGLFAELWKPRKDS